MLRAPRNRCVTLDPSLIPMVADGDITITALTTSGPRFEYTERGLAKARACARKPFPRAALARILIASALIAACLLIDASLLCHMWS